MFDLAVSNFVQKAYSGEMGGWDPQAIRELALQSVPDSLGGSASWLVVGDAYALWARWFLEGLGDPQPFVSGELHYPHLFHQVLLGVSELGAGTPIDELKRIARTLSDLMWTDVKRRRLNQRAPVDREMRLFLWSLFPRCWVCGSEFPDWARERFVGTEERSERAPLRFVDFYRPRGIRSTDLRVEVEHVVPHSGGGADDASNLRLACGWCNRAKGARTLLYEAEGTPRKFRHPRLGNVAVPQPFWVVRMLAMRPRCEHASGCSARSENCELTVAPRRAGGSPNPANLMVVCREHDPLADYRLVATSQFA